jgi:general L-amino acid transport system permease protein
VTVLAHDDLPPALTPPDFKGLAVQAAAVALVLLLAAIIVATTAANLRARGIPLGIGFLFDRAGFSVAETLLPYDPGDSTLRAIAVGVANTLYVSLVVAAASTGLGTLLGIARLSDNPLAAGLAKAWVELVRNTPPILLLIFIYSLWWRLLPTETALHPMPGVLASIRGLGVPRLGLPWSASELVGLAALGGVLLWAALAAPGSLTAVSRPVRLGGALVLLAAAAFALGAGGAVTVAMPRAQGADILGGAILTPELFTILFGLTLYTTGFVAEIVRGGINAVPKGQWEAARALGLSEAATLRRVILPQMLRVVIPPMNSQYINVVKNSTLALAVGYTDFLTIMGTVINKTSHAVEGTVIIVLVYLGINLTLSALLNAYNRRVAARER